MEKHDKFPGSSRTADSLEGDEKSKIDRNDSPSPEPAAAKPEPQLQKSNTAASEEWQYVTGLKRYAVVGVVTLACFILLLDTAIIATAIPKITTDFHSLNDVGWYGSSYLLASAAFTPLAGKIYVRYNSKWSFMIFLGIFELGSLLCALANTSKMLIVARAIAGLGSSGLINGALTIIANCIPLEKRAVYIGFLMSFAQLGLLLGPLFGGLLTQHATWRWCFWINLPAGAVVAGILVFVRIPQRIAVRATKSTWQQVFIELDIIGFCLFTPTIVMLLLALQWGGTDYPWSSATVIGLFCGAAAMFPIFAAWEYRRGDTAMIPWSMIKQRIVWCSCVLMLFFFGGQLIISYYLAIYFQAVKGLSPTSSGVDFLPSVLSQMVLAIVSGVLVGKLGYYLPWAVFSAVLSSVGYGLMSTFSPTTSVGIWVGYQIIAGVGRGSGMQMPMLAIQNTIPQPLVSIGMSLVSFSQTLGGALFLAFAQTCFSSVLPPALARHAPGVSSELVENAGASGFRSAVPKEMVHGVVQAYSDSLQKVFYISTGASVVCFVFAWGIGWKDIRKKKVVEPAA